MLRFAATALLLAVLVSNVHADRFIYAGSGNCDDSDSGCPDKDAAPALWSYKISPSTGPWTSLAVLEKLDVGGLPSWTHTDDKCLYVTLTNTNQVLSYSIGADGKLAARSNATIAAGINPVHIDKLGEYIIVANYHGPDTTTEDNGKAGVASLKVADDCTLSFTDFVPTHGSSANPGRQGASHAHSVNALPGSDTWFFACDLGANSVISFKLDPTTGKITATSVMNATAGSGPRHMAFGPQGSNVAYVLFEMGSYVGAYKINQADGSLTETQRLTTLPNREVFSGYTKAAELRFVGYHDNTLFATNRGYGPDSGSVTAFKADPSSGKLSPGKSTQVGDMYPRGMNTRGCGRDAVGLLVAGQHSSTLTAFSADQDGGLTPTGLNATGPPHPTTVSVACV